MPVSADATVAIGTINFVAAVRALFKTVAPFILLINLASVIITFVTVAVRTVRFVGSIETVLIAVTFSCTSAVVAGYDVAVLTVGFVCAIRTFLNAVASSCTFSVIAGGCAVVIFTVGLIRAVLTVIIAVATLRVENTFPVCALEILDRIASLRNCRKNKRLYVLSNAQQCNIAIK